jgi:hypothetical protein
MLKRPAVQAGDVGASDFLMTGSAAIAAITRQIWPLSAAPCSGATTTRLLRSSSAMQAWNDVYLGRWAEAASELAGVRARERDRRRWSLLADVADALLAALRGDERRWTSPRVQDRRRACGEVGWLRRSTSSVASAT